MNFFFNASGILLPPLALAPAFPYQFSKWGSNSRFGNPMSRVGKAEELQVTMIKEIAAGARRKGETYTIRVGDER